MAYKKIGLVFVISPAHQALSGNLHELLHVGNGAPEYEREPVLARNPDRGIGQRPDRLRKGAGADSKSSDSKRRTLRSVRTSGLD